jgi:hypothetical protein
MLEAMAISFADTVWRGPSALDRTAAQLARGIDWAFAGTALNPPRALRRRSSAESLGHDDRLRALAIIAGFYNRPEVLRSRAALYPAPAAIRPEVTRVRSLGKLGEVLDLRWPSEFEPLWSRRALISHFGSWSNTQLEEAGLDERWIDTLTFDRKAELPEKYFRARANRHGHARWFRHHQGPRPTAVLLHGYIGGTYAVEEHLWPLKRLFDSGLDVVLSVLPFHGLRRAEARGMLPPAFPSGDPRFTIEGMRHLALDHHALFDYLERAGAPALGVLGMSLGGYASALLATLDARLRFGVLFIPLAAIEDFAHRHGRLTGEPRDQTQQHEALRRAHWSVSPFAREPLITGDDVVVIAGDADLITGKQDGERLAQHFQTRLERFLGGHLLHFGRTRAFESLWRMLERKGFTRT